MRDSITDVPGIRVGHAQDTASATGCTVVLCENGAVAGVDVRGGAPGTRETDCLDPSNASPCVHAIYLGGGSAFGLAGAEGVMKYLEERKVGYNVGVCTVPIVPGAVIFDLTVGQSAVRPDAAMGYRACVSAGQAVAQGNVGAGTGAGIGGDHDPATASRMMKGGLGTASEAAGGLIVGALVVVNCLGNVIDPATGEVLAGLLDEGREGFAGMTALLATLPGTADYFPGNTTIGVIATNARLDKAQARRVALMAHDGFARAIDPIHTMSDGDSIFCIATGPLEANLTAIGTLAAHAMSRAILNAVRNAETAYGLPCHAEMRERIKKGRPSPR
ncbi:MAG: P1 family peptidase [Spirochaetia bacterium]|jgi:L-aminopeptidase/D-esterase-like protein